MDLLSEETEEKPIKLDSAETGLEYVPLSRREIIIQAETLGGLASKNAQAMLEACPMVLPLLSRNEFAAWVSLGQTILNHTPPTSDMGEYYFRASPDILMAGPFDLLKGWVQQGLKVADRSLEAAETFFQVTPLFLEYAQVRQIREWSEWAIQIMAMGKSGDRAGVPFFKHSVARLEFMTFRELKDWKNLGIQIARQSASLGTAFLSSLPPGLDRLYRYERSAIYRFCTQLAKTHTREAVDFYIRSPQILLDLSPDIRALAPDMVRKIAFGYPARMPVLFDEIVSALIPLPYPTQKIVLDQGAAVWKHSPLAGRTYFNNIKRLIEEIPEAILPYYVDHSLIILREDEDRGLKCFLCDSEEFQAESRRWKAAARLEDNQRVLAILAQALTGQSLKVQSIEELDSDVKSSARHYPTSDGQTIYLPSFIVTEPTRRENFREYKVAAAHQAGYVEFGTFESGLDEIRELLKSFPQKELAADIFFILEDGRIDDRLKQEYRGLKNDLDQALAAAVDKRRSPSDLPRQEALVEILLRLTISLFDDRDAPSTLKEHVDFLVKSLTGFYQNTRSAWDCFSKTLEIYAYLSRLPNDWIKRPKDEISVRGALTLLDMAPYNPCEPISFRGELGPESLSEPFHMEASAREWIDSVQGAPLSAEELKMLLEILKETKLLQIAEGEDISGQGVFIKDPDGIPAQGGPNEPNTEDFEGRNRSLVLAASRPSASEGPFYYDEWDYREQSYRRGWCRLLEMPLDPQDPRLIDEIQLRNADLIQKVRNQFQRIRPHLLETVRRVDWGDELDLPALIQGIVDKKAGGSPTDKIFSRREKRIRKISTLILVDMSASTDDLITDRSGSNLTGEKDPPRELKVIDIERESLVVIMEALDALNDEYAIFGFSGYGKDRVDFYRIKDFNDPYSRRIKAGISGMEPKQSTRMGTAIRHAAGKMRNLESDQRLLILLSDGFPQDHDYGEDRSSIEYGLHDTMMALLEAKREGIRPFCITVDQSGNDYLKKMCDPHSYLVIKDAWSLPEILPKVVESLII